MRTSLTASAAALAILVGSTAFSGGAQAANARNPYGNVDRRDDRGNDTGDSQVERLNNMQLNQNYQGPYYPVGSAPPSPVAAPMAPVPDEAAPAPAPRRPAYRRVRPHQ